MITILKRQRRRIALIAFSLATILIASCLSERTTHAAPVIGAVLIAAFVCALVAISKWHRMRFIFDGVTLGICVVLLSLVLTDALQFSWHVAVGFSGLILIAIWARLPDRVLPKRDFTDTQTYRSPQSIYTLWSEHLPDPGLLDRHWSSELQSLKLDRANPNVRYAVYQFPKGRVHKTLHFTEIETYEHFAYDFSQGDLRGNYRFAIKEYGLSVDVTLTLTLFDLPFSMWFSAWLDDVLGDEADHHRAHSHDTTDTTLTSRRLRFAPPPQSGLIPPEPVPTKFTARLSA